MIRYWEYVIRPLAQQKGFNRIAVYNCSRELFEAVCDYCRKSGGLIYLINHYDFIDDSYLAANQGNISLVLEQEADISCQIVLIEKDLPYRNMEEDLNKIHFKGCQLLASNIYYEKSIIKRYIIPQEHYYSFDALPFGGMHFETVETLKTALTAFLKSENLWDAVEKERRQLEKKLKNRSIHSFTHRSCIYNAEEMLRKSEINKVKKEYKEKIEKIKNSKRYKIGSKIADLSKILPRNEADRKETSPKKLPRTKYLDCLVRDLEVSSPENIYKTYINYSPILKTLKLPLTEHEQTIVDIMEQEKRQDRERYCGCSQEDLVSVIMPTFNRGTVICQAVETVLKQSYKNFELLIIDDFSTDNTEEILKKYESDGRVKYLKNTHVKGVCGARNTGLEKAKGVYIAYLDTDNEWDEDFLLLSINKLKEQAGYYSIYSAQKVWKLSDEELKAYAYRFGMYSLSMLENRNYVDINSFIHSRKLFTWYGGFDEDLKRMVDWELILRYSRHHLPYAYAVVLCDYFEEGKQEDRISNVADENYSLFASKFSYNKLNLPEAERIIENGYEMYSNADCRIYAKRRCRPAIIIPNYEALGCLKLCIASIRKYTKTFDYEIIIVDNCSSEKVQNYLKDISGDLDVKVILNEYNMGFTYAVNQGMKAARPGSDYILLNNDAIVTENWLEEFYLAKDRVPEAGLIVPRQVLIPQTKTMCIHVPDCNRNREQDVNLSFHHKNIKDIVTYARYGYIELSFAAFFMVMITKDCYEKLGLLDEVNGRHYKSDRLYCGKAMENGIKMIYTPFSKAYHLLQQSTVQLKEKDEKMYDIIFRKNNWDDLNGIIDPLAKPKEGD